MQTLRASANCPSCGAPFEFMEGANVWRCPFCNLPLLFQSPNHILSYYLEPKSGQKQIPFLVDRFRKENGESLSKKVEEANLCYLPYWRFTSEVFYALIDHSFSGSIEEGREAEILSREWDTNFPAHVSNDLGLPTLGMRPEWLKLRLLTDGSLIQVGEVLELELDSLSAKDQALQSFHLLLETKETSGRELIVKPLSEILSLIYFPLWVVNFIAGGGSHHQIIDGITGRTLKQSAGYFELKRNGGGQAQELCSPKIVPHRCPECGWDLPLDPFHLVFPCGNCDRIWKISDSGYVPIVRNIAKAEEGRSTNPGSSVGYYPFWVFETKPQKERTFSIQDLAQLLPSEIGWFKVQDKSRPFLFYIPAFEMKNLGKIPTISLAFTRSQPDFKEETKEKTALVGAVRSEEDAKRIAEILWLSLISSKMNLDFDQWKDVLFENGTMIWFPFYEEGNFLEDAVTGYAFQRIKSPGSQPLHQ
ncbi:MAG: hypothetical protein WCE90_12515 [Candidatus Zixiibacteriota bacterium]